MISERFISEVGARYEFGWSENGWRRFVEAAGLTFFGLPGGARAVEREALMAAVEKLAVPMPPYSPDWTKATRKS